MNNSLYLGIDQGSGSTKGVLLNESGDAVADFNAKVPARLEQDRCVEQDPEGLLASVVEIFIKAKQWAQTNQVKIASAGLALQRSGVLAWRASDGVPVHPMITWADTRTYPIIQSFGAGAERISSLTGLPTIPNFAAGKVHLLQRQFLDPAIKVGTLDSFILYRLSARKAFATEETMAARTMLYDLQLGGWSDQLCREFKIDRSRLAPIRPSLMRHVVFEDVPIVALLGDQQAAVIGRPGASGHALLNLGTIASLLVETGAKILQKPGLMTSVLYSRHDQLNKCFKRDYLIEITSAITGTVLLEPVRLGWCSDASELQAMCDASYGANPDGGATAYYVNHRPSLPWYPQRTPNVMYARPQAGVVDRVRAVVENVGNLVVRLIEEFQQHGLLGDGAQGEIVVTGGGSELNYLLQYISDVTGRVLHRMPTREATARGAALAALMGVQRNVSKLSFAAESPRQSYYPEVNNRRKNYLRWLKLELDLFNGNLAAGAELD